MTLRADKVASVIKEEVGNLFVRDFNDPSYGFMTVMEVQMSPDLRIAKVYVSIFGDDKVKKSTLKMLEEQKAHIRSFIGSHLRLKFTPSLQFYLDETLDRVDKIDRLIKEAHRKDHPDEG